MKESLDKLLVKKSNSQREFYRREKLITSLKKAGIGAEMRDRVVRQVEKNLYPGISTEEIHRLIYSFLKDQAFGHHGPYNLKRALFALGPTGFPFERFVGRLLEEYGYKTKIDIILSGKCVSHEIDVVAIKANKFRLVECKFHNRSGYRSDVKVPLYVKARYDDILNKESNRQRFKGLEGSPWLFTNTKFSSEAIAYSRCVGIRVTGWNYPPNKSIQRVIEDRRLYPVTLFSSLNKEEQKRLLEENIVVVNDLWQRKEVVRRIVKDKYDKLFLEIDSL